MPSANASKEEAKTAAAVKLQANARRHAKQSAYVKERDRMGEESRKQWIAYYVSTGQHALAREYGWDGEAVEKVEAAPRAGMPARPSEPSSSCPPPREASATKIQSLYRGKTARDQKEERSRLEWIEFYRGTGQLGNAKELGWEPDAAEAPTTPAAPSNFTAPKVEVTPLVVANLTTTSRGASRTASPRKSPRSKYGLRGWFSSLFGVVNDYDDPALEYDGNSTNGVNTHQSATKLQAAARGQLARRQAAKARPRSPEDRAAATLQWAQRQHVELQEDAAARAARAEAARAEGARRDAAEEHLAAAALTAGVESGSPNPGGLTRKAMEDGTCRQLRGVIWKRNAAFPRYQPRYVFVDRLDSGLFSLFYRSGDEDGTGDGELRSIPLDSVSSVSVLDNVRYEFGLVSSMRKAKYRFRVDKEEKLEIWTKGLNFLRGPGGRAS